MIERRPSAKPKGTVAGGKASAEPKLTEKEEDLRLNRRERWLEGGFGGLEEASAEPKLTEKAKPELAEKAEPELTEKEETEFLRN